MKQFGAAAILYAMTMGFLGWAGSEIKKIAVIETKVDKNEKDIGTHYDRIDKKLDKIMERLPPR